MESIKRLRKYANGPCVYKDQKRVLLEIAEAFEVEHAEAYAKAYDNGYDEGFANADELIGYHDEEWAKHDYYRWQDADSETIRIGDKVSTEEFGEVEVEGFIHNAVAFYNYEEQPARLCTIPTKLCHRRAQTVEDILREFAEKWLDTDRCTKFENEVVAEYAQRLRLAGDE